MTIPNLISVPLIQKLDGSSCASKELFQDLTGALWLEEMHFQDAHPYPQYHIEPNTWERDMMKFLKPLYHSYLKKPPQLYIKEGKDNSSHSLHTYEKIVKGTVVAEYLGAWDPERKQSSSYRWGPIDGQYHRNYGPMIEDGFPNICAFHFYGFNQVPQRIIFIALEDIAANDMIAINYGMCHSVKLLENHLEYRLEQMIDFFKKHPLSKILTTINALRKKPRNDLNWMKNLELENLGAKLQYLFQTPTALKAVLERGTLTKQDLLDFYAMADVRYNILGFPFQPNPRERELMRFFDLLKNNVI